nr:uncharacterized protein LOC129278594 [Lytechinus pictus]
MAEMVDTCTTTTLSQSELGGWSEDIAHDDYPTPSSMELVPYTPPQLYGPFLPPGMDAGHSMDDFQASSSLPNSFMANDGEAAASQGSDTKDSNAVRGVCGLRNMGNTCFMNSGLQCLLHHPRLSVYLLDHEGLPEEGMASHFTELLQKTWAGEYSVLHPSSFKDTMGFIHPQFKDFRQHDGQEFLALLLDTLHEELNQANRPAKSQSPATDFSEESSDSHYASEASTSKLSELEALDIDSGKEETSSTSQNNRRNKMEESEEEDGGSPQRVGEGKDGMRKVEEGEEMEPEDGEEGATATKLPSIAEFYMKDVKTLNTNMLQGEEISPSVSESSAKFPKKDKSPILSSIRNPMDPIPDASSRSIGKPKKSNVLAAKKNKAYFRTGTNNQEKSTGEDQRTNQEEPDPIKRMKMDLNSESIAKIYKETNGLSSPMKFHDYVTSMDDAKSVNIFTEKMTNKLAELEGPADSTTGLKGQILCSKFEDNSAEPTTCSSKQFDNEKQLGSPCADLLDKGGIDTKLGRSFLPNNQQYFAAICKAQEELGEKMKVDSSSSSSTMTAEKGMMMKEREGEMEWDMHLRRNQSVVIDTFQGQFKSTVVCAVCGHVSIMFEPFMYLSVPLPRAMEKQLIVTIISNHGHLPTRHLVTLNRFESVRELRIALKNIISGIGGGEEEERDVILAEVLDHHVSRFLEDGIQLRYVNDCYRLLYAFEVSSNARERLYSSLCPEQGDASETEQKQSNFMFYMNEHSNMSSQSDDVITHMGDATPPSYQPVTSSWDIEVTTSTADELSGIGMVQPPDITSTSGLDSGFPSNTMSHHGDVFTNIRYYDPTDSTNCEGATSFEGTLADSTETLERSSSLQAVHGSSSGVELWADSQADSTPWVSNQPEDIAPANSPTSAVIASWKSCAICLEELPPHQLLTHQPCGGVLCAICMERAVKHYGDQTVNCPVCRQEIDPATDYVAMAGASAPNLMKRVLLLSVTFRNDVEEDGVIRRDLLGHPRVLYSLNDVSGEELFCQVESLMPIHAPFSLVLSDSQGLSCSRCSYDLHCTGCQLVREVDITLNSDDHLTVVYHNLPSEIVESTSRVCEDQSVAGFQGNEPITLRDCFQAFTESETLDEHNPWFCSECKKPQPANKTISVCRFPDTLIVYLKRFVFHQAMSTKLDNKVLFPVEDMDVGEYMSISDSNEDLVYDLQGAVSHFGGVNAGHYTAYVKNPWTGQWQYCNDETVSQQEPSEQDASSVYILFYSRKGSYHDFTLPPLPPPTTGPKTEEGVALCTPPPLVCSSSSASSSTTSSAAPLSPPQTRMEEPSPMEEDQQAFMEGTDLDKLIQELNKEDKSTAEEGGSSEAEGREADATHQDDLHPETLD